MKLFLLKWRSLFLILAIIVISLIHNSVSAQIIYTYAGTGTGTHTGDGGAATAATLYQPQDAEVRPNTCGAMYFADGGNNCVRQVSRDGIITAVAGTGTYSYSGDGGAATAATLAYPTSVIVDAGGNVYIADYENNAVRKVNTSGIISTVAGTGTGGYSGDGGPATAARLSLPLSMVFDASGNLYISEGGNSDIRKVNTSGVISTFAGRGSSLGDGGPATAAQFSWPRSLVFDGSGNLYIADEYHHRVRIINTSGVINTYAGNGTGSFGGDGGAATAAEIYYPNGVDYDAYGNLYIAEYGNNIIRKVNSSGIISTIAGTRTAGYSGDGGAPTAARLSAPTGVVVENTGRIFIADYGNNRIRVICVTPTVSSITGPVSLCIGATISLSDTTQCGTWSSSDSSIASVGATGVVLGVSSGTAIISYEISNTCGTAYATHSVTVNPAPNVGTITGPASICAGTTATFTESVTGGTWSCSNGLATVSASGVVSGISTGTDTIFYSVGNACDTAKATYPVTISGNPVSGTISGPNKVCVLASITLSETATGGTWTSSDPGIATVNSSGVATGLSSGTVSISYSVTNACGTSFATKDITVVPNPSTTVSATLYAVCVGNNTHLVATGATNYSWSPGSSLSATAGTSVIATPIATTTYTITGSAGGCSDTITLTISVNSLPVISVPSASICNGSDAVLSASGATTYIWSPAISLSASTGATVTASPGTTIIYTVTGTDIHGCEGATPVNVTVLSVPGAPSVTTPINYCIGATAVALSASGAGILWYNTATGGSGVTTAPVPSTAALGTTSYYVSQTVAGCESPRAEVQVNIVGSGVTAFSYDIKYGCNGDTVAFSNSSTGGTLTYLWRFGDANSDTSANPTHIYQQGTYFVTLVSSNRYCVDSISKTLALVHPVHALFMPSDSVICQGATMSFSNYSVDSPQAYMWHFGDGSTSTLINPTHNYGNSGTYDVKLVATNFIPCSDSQSIHIVVDSQYKSIVYITDTAICSGTYITFDANYSTTSGTGIRWSMGNGDSLKNSNPVVYSYPTAGTYTITAIATFRKCLPDTANRIVNVNAEPYINLGNDTSICLGSETFIQLTDYINAANPLASWLWSTGQKTASIEITAPGRYFTTVTINGCQAADTMDVFNDCYMSFPNVFTPNGDGINDYFYPRQLLSSGLTSFKMDIYNRWGQLIFETNEVEGRGWDGKFNNILQPEGVYIFIVDATFKDGNKEHHNGNITLFR